jgi:hypothetical protein
MQPEGEVSLERAREASADELNALLHEADEKILIALLDNPHLQEKHVELLLERADLSAAMITAVAESAKGKWMACEGVRLRVAQHPHAPKRIALAALRQVFLFNLVRLSLMPAVPGDIRRAAEEAILTRVPHLAVGEKLTLARRGPARVAGAILAEGHPQAMKLALANGFLSESQVLKILAKDGVPERVVAAIAVHPKWSCLYNVRVALVRNAHTPPARIPEFLKDLTLRDLQELAKLRDLTGGARNLIARELEQRTRKKGGGASAAEESR